MADMASSMRDHRLARRDRFDALYAAHGRPILAYALRRTTQPADAADVLAEAFLVAWRRLDAVPAGDEARLWLYGVARRVLANQRRGARRRARLGERLAGALAEHVVPDPAEAGGTAAVVREALARAPADDREVLQLASWEGLTPAEMAVVLGVPAATVRTRLHRARRRLRDALLAVEGLDGIDSGAAHAVADERSGPCGHDGGDERPLVRDHEDHP